MLTLLTPLCRQSDFFLPSFALVRDDKANGIKLKKYLYK